MTTEKVNTLKFNTLTQKQATKDILIRYYSDSSKRNQHTLKTVNTLRKEIGDAFTVKFVDKFWGSNEQRMVFKLRRGIEIQKRTTDDDKKSVRTEYEIKGTTGHVTAFKTSGECLNFIQLVFGRRVDVIAFKADKLEFIDDGQLSRAEKSKLQTVGSQLMKVVETIDGIKRICLTGQLGSGTVNQNIFEVINAESTVETKISKITDMIDKGRESEFWKS